MLFTAVLLVVSSSATSHGCRIRDAGEVLPLDLSTTGACVLREDRCAGHEMSGHTDHMDVNNRSEVY